MEANDQRNFMVAIVLMVVFLLGYQTFILGPQERARSAQRQRAAAERTITAPKPANVELRPPAAVVAEEASSGARVAFDAPSVNGSILLKGARIDDLALKKFFQTVEDKAAANPKGEVTLLAPEASVSGFYGVVYWKGAGLPDENATWSRAGDGPLTPEKPLVLNWKSDAATVERTIAVDQDYMFTITDKVTNTGSGAIAAQPIAALRQRLLAEHLKPPPQAVAGMIGLLGANNYQQRSYADMLKDKADKQTNYTNRPANIGWIGLTTKYWMAAFAPDQKQQVTMSAGTAKIGDQTLYLAGYTGAERVIKPGDTAIETNHLFAGAKVVSVLERYRDELKIDRFDDAVDWGWLGFITKPFYWLLAHLRDWFGSLGLAILGLTVLVRAVFFPLQNKAYEASLKMRKLQPEIERIKERFAADKARQGEEMRQFMVREKINPVAGCLPIIPTMFVFWALFHTLSVTIELRHAPFFGWIGDMSAADPTNLFNLFGLLPFDPTKWPIVGGFLHLGAWPVFYGITMWGSMALSTPPTDPTQKMMLQFMPVVFTFFFGSLAAGLVIYYTWSNILSIVQQYVNMRRFGIETQLDKLIARLTAKPKAGEGS